MYRVPKTLRSAPAAVLLVFAAAAPAPAAPFLTDGERPVETRFVLYAIEDLFRDTWPDAVGVGDANAVRRFVARRERIVHDLGARVREGGLGEEHKNELVERLELYMNFVRERGERLATDLDECAGDLNRKRDALVAEVYRDEAEKKARAAAALVDAALDHDPSTDPLAESFGLLFLGMAADAAIQQDTLMNLRKAKAAWDRYYWDTGKADYDKKAEPYVTALLEARQKEFEGESDAAATLARTLAAGYHWDAAETPFVAGTGAGERKKDPFSLVRRTDAEPIETGKGDSVEAAARLARAKKYEQAGDLIPGGENAKAYDYYRTVCYEKAGVEANRSAALTAGTDGFSGAKGTEAAKRALEVWQKYLKAGKDHDASGAALHQYALALAYNGKALKAYLALRTNAKLFTATPVFYYDTARICSAAAGSLPKQDFQEQALMLQDASLALDQAVYLGFNDFERAKNIRDLKALREADEQMLEQRRTFKQIVGAP